MTKKGVVRKLDYNKLDQKYSNFIYIYYIDKVRITKSNFSNFLIFIKLECFWCTIRGLRNLLGRLGIKCLVSLVFVEIYLYGYLRCRS